MANVYERVEMDEKNAGFGLTLNESESESMAKVRHFEYALTRGKKVSEKENEIWKDFYDHDTNAY